MTAHSPASFFLESIQDPPHITVAAFVDEFVFRQSLVARLDDGLNNVVLLARKPFLPDP